MLQALVKHKLSQPNGRSNPFWAKWSFSVRNLHRRGYNQIRESNFQTFLALQVYPRRHLAHHYFYTFTTVRGARTISQRLPIEILLIIRWLRTKNFGIDRQILGQELVDDENLASSDVRCAKGAISFLHDLQKRLSSILGESITEEIHRSSNL